VVQVTSSIPEEGKTTLALALARLLVQNGNDVILVDSDLRRATIERRLGLPEKSAGLTDFVLDHDDDFVRFLVNDPKSDVRIMPSGSAEFAIATDIFSSGRMRHIVDILRQNADYVIFDSPPVMAVADARLIGRFVDTTLFVARWNKTPVKVARAALKTLREGGTDIAGLVLQRVDLKRFSRIGYGDSGYYYHYGRYGQYYKT
jgi:capsular exopolysaccharide synthesis family protein